VPSGSVRYDRGMGAATMILTLALVPPLVDGRPLDPPPPPRLALASLPSTGGASALAPGLPLAPVTWAPAGTRPLNESTRQWLKILGGLALTFGVTLGVTAVCYLSTGQHLYGDTPQMLYASAGVGGGLLLAGTVMMSVAYRF